VQSTRGFVEWVLYLFAILEEVLASQAHERCPARYFPNQPQLPQLSNVRRGAKGVAADLVGIYVLD